MSRKWITLDDDAANINCGFVRWPGFPRCPSWMRWSPWEAPATALAAAEAAGMPVRRPRRPAAVSAAFEAGAGPELGCAGQLERAAEAPNGEVSSLSVGRCVSRRVGRSSEVDGSISRLGLRFLGLFAGAGALCSLDSRKQVFYSRLFVASLDRFVAVLVRVGRHDSFAESPLCSSPPLPFVRSRLSSRDDGKRRCRGSALAVTSRACRLGSQCAVRVFR